MDPANAPLPVTLEERMQIQEQNQLQLLQVLADMNSRLAALQAGNPAPAVATPPVTPVVPTPQYPRMAIPSKYAGDPKRCRGFLNQCTIFFDAQPGLYSDDHTKVAYVISLLTDRALDWASPLWEKKDPILYSWTEFVKVFRLSFDEPGRASSTASALLRLKQGSSTIGQYALQFRTYAGELSWPNDPLVAIFWEGLSDRIKDELAAQELPSNLDQLISVCNKVDVRLLERQRERNATKFPSVYSPSFSTPPTVPSKNSTVEPMQIDGLHLSATEKKRRRDLNLCFYCASPAHLLKDCKLKSGNEPL